MTIAVDAALVYSSKREVEPKEVSKFTEDLSYGRGSSVKRTGCRYLIAVQPQFLELRESFQVRNPGISYLRSRER
jgi:hypothetical protein